MTYYLIKKHRSLLNWLELMENMYYLCRKTKKEQKKENDKEKWMRKKKEKRKRGK